MDMERRVAGEVLFKKGHMVRDWRSRASIAVVVAVLPEQCYLRRWVSKGREVRKVRKVREGEELSDVRFVSKRSRRSDLAYFIGRGKCRPPRGKTKRFLRLSLARRSRAQVLTLSILHKLPNAAEVESLPVCRAERASVTRSGT